jgi:site-specific DNA recombinase
VRVSTAKQGEGVSLEAQRDAIEHFASKNNITIIEWFEEKETAAKSGRPVFNAMISKLKRHRAAGVVMHKIDRSARNFADWAKIGDLADAGIDVHFATEALDFRSRGGRLSADIQAVIAADYIRNLREETLKGLKGRLKQGIYPFAAPIGYLDNGGGKLKTPDPKRAPLVKKAFDLYATGQYPIRSLRTELIRLGLRGRTGKPPSKGMVENMLGNPFYCGVIRIIRTGDIYQGKHKPLITADRFQLVQDIKAGFHKKKLTRHNHVYRGLFRCGGCKAAMIPEKQKGHVYYRCQAVDCPTNCVREEMIQMAASSVLSAVRFGPDDIERIAAEVCKWAKEKHLDSGVKALSLEMANTNTRLDSLTDALVDRVIDNDAYNQRKEKLLLQKTRLGEALENARRKGDVSENIRRFLELARSLNSLYISAKPDEKRQLVEMATSNRTVSEKYPYLEPENWLAMANFAPSVLYCAHSRATNRTPDPQAEASRDEFIEKLASVACSDEVKRVQELAEKIEARCRMEGCS